MNNYFKKNFGKFRAFSLIWSVILLAAGIFLIARPGTAVIFFSRLIGIALLVSGIYFLVISIAGAAGADGYADPYSIAGGIVLLVLGIIFTVHPQIIAGVFGVILAILLIVYGINDLLDMQMLRSYLDERWIVSLILGIITVILGIIVLINPFASQEAVMRLTGAALVYAAVSGLFVHIRAGSFAKRAAESADDVTGDFRRGPGRSRYDENGKEIIDSTATEEEADDSFSDEGGK